jgi:hypothetical protein
MVVFASLAAAKAVQSRWGSFVPELLLVCFPSRDSSASTLELRLFSRQALRMLYDAWRLTGLEIRFDSADVSQTEFRVRDVAGGHLLIPFQGSAGPYEGLHGEELQNAILADIQRAKRAQVRFNLITDETVTAFFYFGSTTSPTVRRLFRACGQSAPGS